MEIHRNKYYMYIHLLLERIWLSFSMKWRQILPESKTGVFLVNNKPGAQKVARREDWVTNSYSEPPPPNDLQRNNRTPKQNMRVTFVWQNIYLLRQIKSVLSFFASQSNFRVVLGPLAEEPVRSSNYYGHFVVVIGPSHRQRAKSPLGTVLIINLLGKGFTSRACMGDGGSIWWAPVMAHFSWLFCGAKASRLNKTEESPKVENNFAFAQPCYQHSFLDTVSN